MLGSWLWSLQRLWCNIYTIDMYQILLILASMRVLQQLITFIKPKMAKGENCDFACVTSSMCGDRLLMEKYYSRA